MCRDIEEKQNSITFRGILSSNTFSKEITNYYIVLKYHFSNELFISSFSLPHKDIYHLIILI